MPLTETEYWRIFEGVRTDLAAAVKSNHVYLTIHNLKRSEHEIQRKISKYPEFWTTTLFSLQTTFFISFGRLFDSRRDSFSIQKLVEATITSAALFSKAGLRERKRQAAHIYLAAEDPPWLVAYVKDAWEPTIADLEPLRPAFEPHLAKFKAIYQPIRHKVYAHRSIEDETAVYGLFSKALIEDVEQILRFLHTLLWAISEMAWNAKKPDLTDYSDYEADVRRMDGTTEEFIRQLP